MIPISEKGKTELEAALERMTVNLEILELRNTRDSRKFDVDELEPIPNLLDFRVKYPGDP